MKKKDLVGHPPHPHVTQLQGEIAAGTPEYRLCQSHLVSSCETLIDRISQVHKVCASKSRAEELISSSDWPEALKRDLVHICGNVCELQRARSNVQSVLSEASKQSASAGRFVRRPDGTIVYVTGLVTTGLLTESMSETAFSLGDDTYYMVTATNMARVQAAVRVPIGQLGQAVAATA